MEARAFSDCLNKTPHKVGKHNNLGLLPHTAVYSTEKYAEQRTVCQRIKIFEQLFLPCVFMMLLLIAVYCSFTVFPPHMILFEDIQTGMYGIIPEYIDSGAIALDTLYRV